MAYIYLLLCGDGSIYTGAAKDLVKRIKTHLAGAKGAAAYTKAKGARRLLCAFYADCYGDALKGEYRIKQLTRAEKERLIREPEGIRALLSDISPGIRPLPPEAWELKEIHSLFQI